MPTIQTITQLTESTAAQITHSKQDWTGFLTTAARLYKYPYPEQLMIYAQRPNATACASYDLWNKRMGRFVHRHSQGIALIDATGDTPKIKYVFDVSDTGGREQSRRPLLWEMRSEHEDTVSKALENEYGVSGRDGLADQIRTIAAQFADLYWQDNRRDILYNIDGSFAAEYDEFNQKAAFTQATAISITYAALSRCGFDPDEYIDNVEYLNVFDFNTPNAVTALGTAVSDGTQQLLRQIERTVKQYDREQEQEAERSAEYGTDQLQAERGLSDSRPDDGAAHGGDRQIWEDAEAVSDGASENVLQFPAAIGETVSAPVGDRADSEQPVGADDAPAYGISGRDGSLESIRSDEVGGLDEHLESPSGGNNTGGADIQLNKPPEQLSLFPSEAEQIAAISQAESQTPSAFSISQAQLDMVLQSGSSNDDSRLRIAAKFIEGKPIAEIADFLRKEYRGGKGFKTAPHDVSVWFSDEGIRAYHFDTVRYVEAAQFIPWEDAAQRIGELLEQGQYLTNVELAAVDGYERSELAQRILYVYHDFDEPAREQGYLPSLESIRGGGYPEETAVLAEKLAEPEFLATFTAEYKQFLDAYQQDHSLMRFHYHHTGELFNGLNDLALPRQEYATDMTALPDVQQFITEDEINDTLAGDSAYEDGKLRIFSYFVGNHSAKEKADFLKDEYGWSGRSHAVSGASSSWVGHSGKGMELKKGDCPPVELSWSKVANRIDELIRKRRYLTTEEKTRFEELERQYSGRGQELPTPVARYGFPKLGHEPVSGISEPAQPAEQVLLPDVITSSEPHPLTQADIDAALQEWNGDIGSKRRVQQYMLEHARDKETAAFLRGEYGDDLPAFPITGNGVAADMPWTRVQRHLARLIQENRFLNDTTPKITTETVAVYPSEQNHLPYDIVIERLHIDEPEQEQPELPPAENFRITDDALGVGGAKSKYRNNVEAIRALQRIEADGRRATPEEQEILSRYTGWGGVPQAFDRNNTDWSKEYAELNALLPGAEYASARASTLNAHYTAPVVIKSMYAALERMGFRSGSILEPACGVGNFFGLLPESMAQSRLFGVELDSVSGRIARQLYPNADIKVTGFEKTDNRDFYDLVIGNVPFGSYKVADRQYDKLNFYIHDYFLAKSIDQARPGGVVAVITSKGTMDKQSPEVRRHLAERAELLGAVRLPNNAFKANAGTEVTSDILFFRKRERPMVAEPEWVHLAETEDGVPINSYFADHPEMVLGKMAWSDSMYGSRKETACLPIDGAVLADQLAGAMLHIKGEYAEAELPDLGDDQPVDDSIPADPNVKNYAYTVVNGEVYYRENSRMVRPSLNATAKERIRGMVELRDCVYRLIDQQLDGYVDDAVIHETQDELNRLYDTFVRSYGRITNRGNHTAFSQDSAYYLLSSLEVLDDDGAFERKADMFTKRTVRSQHIVTSVDTASEALALSISEKARVDLPYMASLSGKTEEQLATELSGVIFRDFGDLDPTQMAWAFFDPARYPFVTADEFLSGNVRAKLKQAQGIYDALHGRTNNTELLTMIQTHIAALERVQPVDLTASEIAVKLGATWIDPAYIQQFMEELLDPPFYVRDNITVHFSPLTAEWSIEGKRLCGYSNVAAYMTYGTSRANAYYILEDSLNQRDVRIYDTVEEDGKKKRVLNSKETTLAAQKQQAIRDAFRDWIWKDPDRRHDLVTKYNELFNSIRPREYDGSHITFSGINPEIELREHQKSAIAHILYGGNTLLAHEVGAGKTFEMVAAAMESKRLGLCSKSLIAVPNHLTEQWAAEFLRLYPSANLLVTTKKDFEKNNRKRFCSRITTGDYDAIIMGHSQFERIPISQERQERLLQEQIDEITAGIDEIEASGGERFTVKQLERTKRALETRLDKLLAGGNKDDVVTFEQLGVDKLFVDESHNYKNLFLYSKMQNVAGPSTSDAQKSSDMFAKCRYMDERTGGKGVVFATGTPVSNSMTEIYTMQRYLQYATLERMNMVHFDCWASNFGETTTAIELAPEGTGYRARTRFARFHNLPELMNLFKESADTKTADQLDLPVPQAVYETVVAKPTDFQKEYVQSLSERATAIHAGIDPKIDNMLKVTSDGRKLGLDQRIINPLLPDDPQSKVNLCVQNILRIWREGQADRLTQLVFSDISTPKSDGSFNVYDDIRAKLVASGVPAEEVAFIHEANTETQKKELFGKVRSGQVRVLIGSTAKMGAGTNVQDRLIAMHDLDCPWRPGDLAQRAGRIVRQGNRNPEVHIYRYVTDGTFDSYLWQTVENKQRFISQIMTSKSPVRVCEDVDETTLSFAEIKALCAGNPLIKEKMQLDIDVAQLKLLKSQHLSQQYRLEDDVAQHFPAGIERNKGFIAGFEKDMETLAAHPLPGEGFVGMVVKGDALTDKDNAGAAILEACKEVRSGENVEIGSYRGFAMRLAFDSWKNEMQLRLKGAMTHEVTLGTDARGNLIRIENALAEIPNRQKATQAQLDNLCVQLEAAKAELGKPFPQEAELTEKSARLALLDAELNLDSGHSAPCEQYETDVAKSARPSVLEALKAPCKHGAPERKQRSQEWEAR